MRIPCNGSRGKETPAVTRCKFTASVRPGCKLQDISVVERVVHLTEERCFTDLPVICIGVIHHFCTGSNVEVISALSQFGNVIYQCTCGQLALTSSLAGSNLIVPYLHGNSGCSIESEVSSHVLVGRFIYHICHVYRVEDRL